MKYFGYYGADKGGITRNCTLAAVNKMKYIAEAITASGDNIEIISAAAVTKGRADSYTEKIADNVMVRYFKSVFFHNKLLRVIERKLYSLRMLIWALNNVEYGETIMVYHSLGYMWLINILLLIKNVNLILEVEEIFSDVIGNKKMREAEIQFAKKAHSYIFPTILLDQLINDSNKPSVIIHGSYRVEPNRIDCNAQQNNNVDQSRKIHCVYAGTLDPRKGGAIAAAAAEFLPSNYHLHILGFGTNSDIKAIKDMVNEISKKSEATVTYNGLLSGEEYIKFIQNCDIGLSTQDPNADFNATSFPSKILSYLANGLRVVSIRIPAIEKSAVGEAVSFYDNQTPQDIAKAIISIDMDEQYDSRKLIKNLDSRFKTEITGLLNQMTDKKKESFGG